MDAATVAEIVESVKETEKLMRATVRKGREQELVSIVLTELVWDLTARFRNSNFLLEG